MDDKYTGLQRELQELFNRHSIENLSNTPDHVLAAFVIHCLRGWDATVQVRDKWYGFQTGIVNKTQ